MYSRIYEIKQGENVVKRWVEARTLANDFKRATEKILGKVSGRQWKKIQKLRKRRLKETHG